MATKKTKTVAKAAKQSAVKSESFFEIPLELILVEGQIRSRIDQTGEAFLAHVASIREKGVLEPIIVTPKDGKYLLISGERRFLACKILGLKTIPARVIDSVTARDEILALQLTENLQRAELDPIDEAAALLSFHQARHEGMDLDAAINTLITLDRDPSRVDPEVAATVAAIHKISGKSSTSMKRCFSLLKLPEEVQNALREGTIGVTQGYIFAANLDHPLLMDIFRKAVGDGFTNDGLEKAFKKGQRQTGGARKRPFSQFRGSVLSVRSGIEAQADAFRKSDLEALLADLQELISLIEGRLPEAVDDGGPAAEVPAAKQKRPVLA